MPESEREPVGENGLVGAMPDDSDPNSPVTAVLAAGPDKTFALSLQPLVEPRSLSFSDDTEHLTIVTSP